MLETAHASIHTSRASGGIQGERGTGHHVYGWDAKSLKENLNHFFPVRSGDANAFDQQKRMLFWFDLQLVVKGVVPDLFTVIPVVDQSVINRLLHSLDERCVFLHERCGANELLTLVGTGDKPAFGLRLSKKR